MTLVLTAARRMTTLVLCVTATLAVPFAALPADAASGADLIITIDPAAGGAYALRLTCDPDGGIHPRPGSACGVLREVDGEVEALNVNPGPCPRNYDPVDVTVEGHWYDMPVSYHNEFHNRCLMERTLGPLVGAR
jgi:Subtilisin inhibitor-like